MSNRPIRIRAVPRSGEKPPVTSTPARPMARAYIVAGVVVAAAFAILFLGSSDQPSIKLGANVANPPPLDNSPEALVNQYLKEAKLKGRIDMQNRELENKLFAKPLDPDASVIPENQRPLGVSLDQENSAEKVYNDLYGPDRNNNKAPMSPEDRINMRIEQEQWLSQTEKEERKVYIQRFLKDAHDAGYQIDLDENLVVVRVRKITSKPRETLDEVLDNLARKGY